MINTKPLVTGQMVFDRQVPAMVDLTVRVFLEDVSLQDAPAPIITEHIEHHATYKGTPLDFALYGEIPHENNRYAVRVHISRDGSAAMKAGDFISTQSYPVVTHGAPQHVTIRLQQI